MRAGFAAAKHDVLMILDGDLSVRPEDLPKFYRAVADGPRRARERLAPRLRRRARRDALPEHARQQDLLARCSALITGQHVKDTLCGTKVLRRDDYERIAAARSYFGEFDPFGDFDLLFGAARLNLKIVDLPVRYQPRTYGETNISRWRHGWLLLRMTGFAFWKFRVALFRRGDRLRTSRARVGPARRRARRVARSGRAR